jgi:hypothetical protein
LSFTFDEANFIYPETGSLELPYSVLQLGVEITLKHAAETLFSGENYLEIKDELNHSNIKNDLKIRLVEKEGTINVLAVGDINEKTKEINYLEDIKVLTTNNERSKSCLIY